MKSTSKKTLNGNVIQIDKPGKGMDCVLNQVTDVNKVVGRAANKVSY
jgi:hypothetical protein